MFNPNTPTPYTHKRTQGKRPTKQEKVVIQEKFLKSFSMTSNIRAACMAAGIDRSTIYQWQEHDETFSLRFKQAEADANDVIRAEMFRRAVQGVEKPMVSMGKVVHDEHGKPMMVREYSDNLLSLLAKARMPEFREKQQVEVSGPGGGPIQHKLIDALAKMEPAQLDLLDQASRIVDEAVKHGS